MTIVCHGITLQPTSQKPITSEFLTRARKQIRSSKSLHCDRVGGEELKIDDTLATCLKQMVFTNLYAT